VVEADRWALSAALQVSGRAQESIDSAKQSTQEAWDHTKASAQQTADKVGASLTWL